MVSMYIWQQVKAMRARGASIKKIARSLKLSKNTVRKYLRSTDPPQFTARGYKSVIDQYVDKVLEMLDKNYIGTRIFSDLSELGYKGSLATVHRYIREVRKDIEIRKKVTTRVETAPGKQMQYDWKEWDLPVSGKALKIYIHEVVLSYSRKKYYTYSVSITGTDIIRAIASGIEFFGGTATELVIDNPRQMVITHDNAGIVRYNDEFLRFCGLYGIEPMACCNYRARTKGKAERPFYYVQEHLLRGLEVASLCEFDGLLKEFTDKYNRRVHSTLKEIPDDRFLIERKSLMCIPTVEPTSLYNRQVRNVSSDGYISWDGGLYPAPMRLCLKTVMVEPVFGRLIRVYDERGILAAEHQVRLFDKCPRPEHPEHKEINKQFMEKRAAVRSEVVSRFIEFFDDSGRVYIEGLRDSVGTNLYWHLSEIIKYTGIYSVDDVSDVIAECISIGSYHKNSIKRLLGNKKMQKPLIGSFGLGHMVTQVDIKRELQAYKVEVSHE